MTIRWTDGFDIYTTRSDIELRAGIVAGPGFANFATGRLGVGQCMTTGQGYSFAPFASAQANVSLGVAYQVANLSQAGSFMNFYSGSSPICDLRVTSTGALQATRDGNVLGTSAAIITANVWAYLEVEITRHSSAGVFKAYVNGVQLLNLTGVNTGGADIDKITLASGSADIKLDDLYVTDTATKLGEIRIDTVHPSADTATKDWTPSTGTDNYACVDETTISTTDYVSTAGSGDKDYYDLGTISFTPNNIFAVNALSLAKKDDATTRTYRANIKSSSTEGHGATRGLGTSFALYSDIFELDPATSAAWSKSAIDALQAGIEVVS